MLIHLGCVTGNFPQLVARNSWAFQDELGEMYGSVVKFTTIFRVRIYYVFYDPSYPFPESGMFDLVLINAYATTSTEKGHFGV